MQKSKNWIFELYPDSMNPNWRTIIEEELCVPTAISPLHDTPNEVCVTRDKMLAICYHSESILFKDFIVCFRGEEGI